jgi:hypothetical protein
VSVAAGALLHAAAKADKTINTAMLALIDFVDMRCSLAVK